MEVTCIEFDFTPVKTPLRIHLMKFVVGERFPLPVLLVNPDYGISEDILLQVKKNPCNIMSAVRAPDHPFLFITRQRNTGRLSFPFREKIGRGKRRQDMESVYLFVPRFALIHDVTRPFIPFPIQSSGWDFFPHVS